MTDFQFPEPYANVPVRQLLMLDKDIVKQGWMNKKAGRTKFQFTALSNYDKRFFVLVKGWVYYYKDENSTAPQSYFSLKGYSNRVVRAEEERCTALPWVFKLYTRAEGGRTWYFAPESEQLMREWMLSFKQEIEKYNVPATQLRVSRSLPEKKSSSATLRPPEVSERPSSVSDGRRNYFGNQKNLRKQPNKNSLASTTSSSTADSIQSLSQDDYDPVPIETERLSEAEDVYEDFDALDKANQSYLEPNWNKMTRNRETAPHLPLPPPIGPRQQLGDDLYEEVDPAVPPASTPSPFRLPIAPPKVLPACTKTPSSPSKADLSRATSYPTESPPEPPVKDHWQPVPDDHYEEAISQSTSCSPGRRETVQNNVASPTRMLPISNYPQRSGNDWPSNQVSSLRQSPSNHQHIAFAFHDREKPLPSVPDELYSETPGEDSSDVIDERRPNTNQTASPVLREIIKPHKPSFSPPKWVQTKVKPMPPSGIPTVMSAKPPTPLGKPRSKIDAHSIAPPTSSKPRNTSTSDRSTRDSPCSDTSPSKRPGAFTVALKPVARSPAKGNQKVIELPSEKPKPLVARKPKAVSSTSSSTPPRAPLTKPKPNLHNIPSKPSVSDHSTSGAVATVDCSSSSVLARTKMFNMNNARNPPGKPATAGQTFKPSAASKPQFR